MTILGAAQLLFLPVPYLHPLLWVSEYSATIWAPFFLHVQAICPTSYYFISEYLDTQWWLFSLGSLVWEPWGDGVRVPGELLAVLWGELKTQCQGNKKKCKINKNNSKCIYESKAGIWKLISHRVFCLVWSLIGAGGSFEGKINALNSDIINALRWWFVHLV